MSFLRSSLAAAALVLMASAPAAAQQQPAVVGDLLRDVGEVKSKLVSLAEAMPEGTYDWRPMEGVRSVAEVYKHLVSDNYLLAAAAGHEAPASTGIKADDYMTAVAFERRSMSKAEIVNAVRASMEHLETALGATSREDLNANVGVFGMDMTRRGLWIMTVTHLHEHLGQSIAYARSNRIAPPWSR